MQPGSGNYSASSYYPNYTPNPYPTELLTPSGGGGGAYASAPPASPYGPRPDFSHHFDPSPPPPQPSFNHPQFAPNSYAAGAPPTSGAAPAYGLYDPPPPPPPPSNPVYNPASDQGAGYYGGSAYPNLPNPVPAPSPAPALAYEPPIPSYYDVVGSGKFDQYGQFRDEDNGRYGHGGHRSGSDQSDALDEGVYRYDGGRAELYGAKGTAGGGSKSSSASAAMFDDYGRAIGGYGGGKKSSGGSAKIVRAVPKADAQQDVKSGAQKFRVKILPEGWGQNTMDVLCQIGLDGIRMLDPNTSRMLRIYPLETVTRWEVNDPSIYTFWSKSSVDVEPRRIRLQSNSYTTNTILDIVAAATVQLKEMGGKDSFRSRISYDAGKPTEPPAEKKKGFADWMNMIKPANEEKDHWVPDEAVTKCTSCGSDFGAFNRRHHCRNCGDIFCDKCTQGRIALTADADAQPVRVCDRCMAEVTHRLSIAKEQVNRSAAVVTSHEDLAKKLQEEMDRNRKASSGSKSSDVSGRRMREVACPTCTVHLQVQVPASGSETIECGVCQHPFLVSAH